MTMPLARVFALSALILFVAAAIAFGMQPWATAIDYAHRTHPLSWLGADGVPGGMWFDALGFVLPGALAATALWPLRDALPTAAGWPARIGARLTLLSAFAFAAQGLLPIDIDDLDGTASGLHGIAWTLWWIAFAAGNVGLAWGFRKWRDLTDCTVASLAAQVVPLCAFFAQTVMPIALAQRLAFVLWFLWIVWIAGRYRRLRGDG
ncbi:MAG: DUF998 domain-containing protein [Xanthomonadaceae bacterium]|nr:DUF998 domain-containing protein [Xanthomonadaceae bacterium]